MNQFIACSSLFARGFALVFLGLSLQLGSAQTLTHRYSFISDASDSVGNANGVLEGNAYIANGMVVLDGANSSVVLPNNLFTNYDSLSVELWFTNGLLTSANSRLFLFTGPGGTMAYALHGQAAYSIGSSSNLVNLAAPAVAGTVHLLWTQDSNSQTACLYVNGLLAANNTNFTLTPALIGPTTNNCIGGIGSISTGSNYNGGILEFRTYQGALTPLEAAVSDAYGPERAQLDPGALQDIRLVSPPPVGPGAFFPICVFADFADVTNVNISTQPDLVLSSDNTNVIAIASGQRLLTVGKGVADITAGYEGHSNTLAVTVGVPPDIALVHRYSFNEPTNDWIVHDSVGSADGQLQNVVTINRTVEYIAFTGHGELQLMGGNSELYGYLPLGYVALPPRLISSLSEVSIEAWVTWTLRTQWPWQRIFDFGNSIGSGPSAQGDTYLFLTTEANTVVTNGDVARFTITTNYLESETPHLDWTNIMPLNVTSFVAVTYSPVRGVTKFYMNGQPVAAAAATIPLSAIIDTNDWLGRSQFGQDSYFGGRYKEFRIYRGLLSDADVAADYTAGPNAIGVDYVLHDYVSSNSLAVTWGPGAANWFLETSPLLGPGADWTVVTNTPVLQNGRYSITSPISAQAAFFRLQQSQ